MTLDTPDQGRRCEVCEGVMPGKPDRARLSVCADCRPGAARMIASETCVRCSRPVTTMYRGRPVCDGCESFYVGVELDAEEIQCDGC